MSEFDSRTDGQLLAAFTDNNDQVAFAALVERHGPMVHGICTRILGDRHEAQDATQAVFLTLARKAASLKRDPSVGGWLHVVASRLAINLRRDRICRQRHEEKAMEEREDAAAVSVDARLFRREVDVAIGAMPEKYRQPLVLFHLEEHSLEQTARRLGLNVSTVGNRLARAREMLRAKLVRRGVAVGSVGALTTLLSAEAGAAVLPASFVSATAKAAGLAAAGKLAAGVGTGVVSANVAALTKGACNMLFWSSVKTAAIAVAVTGAVVTTGTVAAQKAMEAASAPSIAARSTQVELPNLIRLRREGNLLRGTWIYPTNAADIGTFDTSHPRLGWTASGAADPDAGRFEIYGTNMAERAESGIWHFKMRSYGSNFWVMVMYGTKAPIACIEYIQNTNELRLIRTVWTANGGLDPEKRLDVRTGPNIEELKAKAGDVLRGHLAPVLAMVTPDDLLGAAGETLRFTEADNGKTVTVPPGRTFEIILLNGRDGAGWEPGASEITGESVEPVNKLRRGNCDEFMAEKAPTPDSTLGMYKYRYRAVKPGTSNIRLTHLYPSGPKPVDRRATRFIGEFKLTVRVTEAPESGRAIKGDFDPVRMEVAPIVVRAHVKPYVAGSVGSVGPFMTKFSTLIVTEVLKDQGEKTLKAGAQIALAHDQREPLPAGEFTAYLKTETLMLSGKEHVRYNFTGTAAEGSRYPGAGQGTSHHVAGQ